MNIKKFDFDLPDELIAVYPTQKRDESKLMIVDRKSEKIEIKLFKEIVNYFDENNLIIMNNTKVINARLRLKRETGGKLEFLLMEKIEKYKIWKGICNRTNKIKINDFLYGKNGLEAKVIDKNNNFITLEFNKNLDYNELKIHGEIPLPPYIANKRHLINEDNTRYQTIYASEMGSLASPTAGLHFTEKLLENLKGKGTEIVFITLHVSAGTFFPIKTQNIENHSMHYEQYFINETTSKLINNFLKDDKKKITCVGTTSIRTIQNELIVNSDNSVKNAYNSTNLFIYPGFKFRGIDRLITNFHTPMSTPLLLVSAFAGINLIKKAYKIAIEEKLRFFSYGDSMIIL